MIILEKINKVMVESVRSFGDASKDSENEGFFYLIL
jgi:hypothetical protein